MAISGTSDKISKKSLSLPHSSNANEIIAKNSIFIFRLYVEIIGASHSILFH
jgi:hypothetical protein